MTNGRFVAAIRMGLESLESAKQLRKSIVDIAWVEVREAVESLALNLSASEVQVKRYLDLDVNAFEVLIHPYGNPSKQSLLLHIEGPAFGHQQFVVTMAATHRDSNSIELHALHETLDTYFRSPMVGSLLNTVSVRPTKAG